MRVKVYGGLHHGRVLVLPEGAREGDYVSLPPTLPAGEMYNAGRSNPEEHANERTYVLRASQTAPYTKYLTTVEPPRTPRFVRAVDVPPPPMIPVTVHLSL